MRQSRADVIGVIVIVNLAVACLVWLVGNDPLALGPAQGGFGSLGNLAGLLAAGLLALQIPTMARFPWLERAWGRDVRWSHSLSAAPSDTEARVTIRPLGDGSARDLARPVGSVALIEKPHGVLGPRTAAERRRPAVYLAAGLGLAPIKTLLEDCDSSAPSPIVIVRCSDAASAPLMSQARELAEQRGGAVHVLPGHRRWDGSWLPGLPGQGSVVSDGEVLARLVPDLGHRMVYACGSGKWVEAVRRAALTAGVRRRRLVTERLDW
jgi:ferredoxin-NADP reductase